MRFYTTNKLLTRGIEELDAIVVGAGQAQYAVRDDVRLLIGRDAFAAHRDAVERARKVIQMLRRDAKRHADRIDAAEEAIDGR